ncbi:MULTISPECIES: TetR/AcrR family transcriptional regulator [unclassified Haladaptatus]|uniref:TetR/AcrR family transcriptional regulator n=1 Tax=unclassified Haladaptatus TaxID=2622732 RepID=UPI00209C6017|nr:MULTISPECIES: TetR/AcrR family transcriptional regulator [unclassified Haladaptatus]MCO8243319.1 TetR family transcriptional regulator [Haladaptatus sp. AB643]MCO8253030.1 TetR family transcriptional regulator [Haladaptatus sp. AB618]
MTAKPSFLEDPTDTRGAIMRATYLALCKHGYADLTIQRIADEFPKSKSLLYHHYDGKDDLLLDFLGFMLEQQKERIPAKQSSGSPRDHLNAIFDRIFVTPIPDDYRDFSRAMVELRAQAAHDEKYRNHFTRSDEFFRGLLTRVIQSGIDEGTFHDVDAEEVAEFLLLIVTGAMTKRVTTNNDAIETARNELDAYVRLRLLVDEN